MNGTIKTKIEMMNSRPTGFAEEARSLTMGFLGMNDVWKF